MTWNRTRDVTGRGSKNRAEMGGRRGRRETVCWSRGKREAVQLSVVVLFTKARLQPRSSRACLALSSQHQGSPLLLLFQPIDLCTEPIPYQTVLLKFAVDLFTWTNVPTETINHICLLVASDSSMMLLLPILSFICLAVPAIANVEKTIFTAPDSTSFGDARPNLIDLRLNILSSQRLSVRTVLPVIFPTEKHPRGLSSWYILDSLRPGQRYEVRICWAATVSSNSLGQWPHSFANTFHSNLQISSWTHLKPRPSLTPQLYCRIFTFIQKSARIF
jgi:hypothetical protein